MEKTVKPTINQAVSKGTQSQVPQEKSEKKPSGEVAGMYGAMDKLEAKDPNSLGRQFIAKRSYFQDGGYRPYMIQPGDTASADPLFREISRTLGLGISDMGNHEEELKDITEMTATYLQTDSYDAVNKFIRQCLRRIQHHGTPESRIHNLKKFIKELFDERKEK